MRANKSIRDAVKEQIESVYTAGDVFTGRTFDLRTGSRNESVQIFLQRGAEESQGMASDCRSDLKIIVRKAGIVHDDELDDIAVIVDGALQSNFTLSGIVGGVIYDSFEYLDDDNTAEYSALLLSYIVIH